VNSTAPDKGVGLSLNIRCESRGAGQTSAGRSWNTGRRRCGASAGKSDRIEVRNAQFDVKTEPGRGAGGAIGGDLARQTLDAISKS